jgi:ketosteroid isomerase-like protein
MTDDREQTIAAIYRAFNARDIDGVLAHLAPNVDWPNGMTGGRERGRAAVKRYWEKQWREIDPRVEPLRVDIDGDGKAHVRVHQLVRAKDGTVLDDKKIEHIYSFDGPFVARMDIIDRDPHPEDDEDEDE